MTCDDIRELAPELALGVVEGEQRSEALRHLAECPDCRRLVERMSGVADGLVTLAPAEEPPVGFESAVVDRLGPKPPPKRRARRLFARLAPAAAAAAITAGVLVGVYSDERRTASRYLDTLEVAGGSYFGAKPLLDGAGRRAGVAFAYEGKPSWLLVTVAREQRTSVASAELVTVDGQTLPLRSFRLGGSDGVWGGSISVPWREVATVRLLGNRPGQVLQARIRGQDD
jgi:Putative zinc-finger